MFEFTYIKPNIQEVITDLEKDQFKMTNSQLYTPINELFMKLNETNSLSTTPNFNLFVNSVKHIDENDSNKVQLTCINNENNSGNNKASVVNVDGFIKFSPLLDPIRYLVGKYDISDNTLKNLPLYNVENSHAKLRETDNASYVDYFFSYLSSKMFHKHKFLNAIDCYGNILGLKKNFTMDVVDDLDYLMDNDYFIRNNHILYDMDNEFHSEILNRGSRSRKIAIKICHENDNENGNDNESDNNENESGNNNNAYFELDNIESLDELNVAFENYDSHNQKANNDNNNDLDYINLSELSDSELIITSNNKKKRKHKNKNENNDDDDNHGDDNENDFDENNDKMTGSVCSSNCSSRTSLTNSNEGDSDNESGNEEENKDDMSEDEEMSTDGSDMETSSTASEDKALINIYDFPVNAIFLEKCENTLDYLCDKDEDFGTEELCSALMQVIMSLIAFDKCFEFQHNDLHTNNIMYIPTKKQYLYYKVNNSYYKVPTYGRIFKIIDFGRATYKFRGNQLCSDSFHKDGDAHTQFNFSKHYNSSRPILEPNGSFDLCRLATSLIDFLIDDMEDLETIKDPVILMVNDWCQDDKGRNILWKSNGDERYPGFKLYKMIARNVSKHKPIDQLERPILEKYKCTRKNIKKGTNVMNIDELPCYTGAIA
jgi:hypothetical protein